MKRLIQIFVGTIAITFVACHHQALSLQIQPALGGQQMLVKRIHPIIGLLCFRTAMNYKIVLG